MNKPLVSICCITYNHAPYIRDAIEGFLMQKTNFPYEIIIHDDASTDGTAEIVKEYADKYPDLIVSILQKENQYSKGLKPLSYFVFPNAEGKYIALCEGDDYWTDPLKLQKQFDFMEKHKDCSMSFHRSRMEYVDRAIVRSKYKLNIQMGEEFKWEFFPEDKFFFMGGVDVPTASIFIRGKYLKNLPEWYYKFPVGDMALKAYLSCKGRVGFINEVMGVRRLAVPGSWNDRVRGNKKREISYLEEMISALAEFNKYSDSRYFSEIFKHMVNSDITRIHLGAKESVFSIRDIELGELGTRRKTLIRMLKKSPRIFRRKGLRRIVQILFM